jgi:hypothetical protein
MSKDLEEILLNMCKYNPDDYYEYDADILKDKNDFIIVTGIVKTINTVWEVDEKTYIPTDITKIPDVKKYNNIANTIDKERNATPPEIHFGNPDRNQILYFANGRNVFAHLRNSNAETIPIMIYRYEEAEFREFEFIL